MKIDEIIPFRIERRKSCFRQLGRKFVIVNSLKFNEILDEAKIFYNQKGGDGCVSFEEKICIWRP